MRPLFGFKRFVRELRLLRLGERVRGGRQGRDGCSCTFVFCPVCQISEVEAGSSQVTLLHDAVELELENRP